MKHFNFILVLITVVILAAMGVIFLIATGYGSVQASNWTDSALYQAYLDKMNIAVIPFVVSLIVVLGLCIPKRLFSGAELLKLNGFILLITLVAVVLVGAKEGLSILMIIAALIQLVVIGLTAAGSRRLSFEKTGFFLQIGSALLHLGFILFLLDFMLISESGYNPLIFWSSLAFVSIGMILSFYSQELAKLAKRKKPESSVKAPAEETGKA